MDRHCFDLRAPVPHIVLGGSNSFLAGICRGVSGSLLIGLPILTVVFPASR
jgi:hypothetical protein